MPNPFNNHTELFLSGIQGQNITISVIDINGKEQFHLRNIESDKKILVGENLALGIYILQIISDEEVLNYKIVKE